MIRRLKELWYLGPLRWAWRNWTPAYDRFSTMEVNHFIATLEHQCEELREIELAQRVSYSYRPRSEFNKEFADCISVALNGLRWANGNDPKKVSAALKDRAGRYIDPHKIIDRYIEKYGA